MDSSRRIGKEPTREQGSREIIATRVRDDLRIFDVSPTVQDSLLWAELVYDSELLSRVGRSMVSGSRRTGSKDFDTEWVNPVSCVRFRRLGDVPELWLPTGYGIRSGV